MDERLRFVARLLEGEKMAPLCAEFGISRKGTARRRADPGVRIDIRARPYGAIGLVRSIDVPSPTISIGA